MASLSLSLALPLPPLALSPPLPPGRSASAQTAWWVDWQEEMASGEELRDGWPDGAVSRLLAWMRLSTLGNQFDDAVERGGQVVRNQLVLD